MGLFGDQDAAEVSDNPFYVAPDTYNCVLAEASVVEKKDLSGQGISFKWVIEDEDSDFYGNNLSDWLNIYPDVTSDEITPQIRQAQARLKKRLGEMGLSPDEMNVLLEDDNLDKLVGLTAMVVVVESPDKNDPNKIYTNVREVILEDNE